MPTPDQYTRIPDDLDKLLSEDIVILLKRKTYIQYQLADIEGQLLERDSFEDEESGWRKRAKTAAHYLRRSLGAVNNAINVVQARERKMWSDDDYGPPVMKALAAMGRLHEAATTLVALENETTVESHEDQAALDAAWEALETALSEASEVYFMVATV